jgi:hypothetical protein
MTHNPNNLKAQDVPANKMWPLLREGGYGRAIFAIDIEGLTALITYNTEDEDADDIWEPLRQITISPEQGEDWLAQVAKRDAATAKHAAHEAAMAAEQAAIAARIVEIDALLVEAGIPTEEAGEAYGEFEWVKVASRLARMNGNPADLVRMEAENRHRRGLR